MGTLPDVEGAPVEPLISRLSDCRSSALCKVDMPTVGILIENRSRARWQRLKLLGLRGKMEVDENRVSPVVDDSHAHQAQKIDACEFKPGPAELRALHQGPGKREDREEPIVLLAGLGQRLPQC